MSIVFPLKKKNRVKMTASTVLAQLNVEGAVASGSEDLMASLLTGPDLVMAMDLKFMPHISIR